MKFEWNAKKSHTNLKKHGVSFEEAQTVFNDPLACIFNDKWNTIEEQRELIIGHSANGQLLIVSFTERMQDKIRIISARQATTKERKDYETYRVF